MRFAVDRLDHLVINCRDLEVMASWYQRVLGMEREEFGEPRRTALKFGGQKINLRPHDASPEAWVGRGGLRAGLAGPLLHRHLHRRGRRGATCTSAA